jgi:L-alanine-DL-glutamate epimerase-like enolase superfamily enzyme
MHSNAIAKVIVYFIANANRAVTLAEAALTLAMRWPGLAYQDRPDRRDPVPPRRPDDVAADESILDLTELGEKAAYFDVINMKLDKCGGLTEALAMAHTARGMGKQVMVGNMGGSTLAMAPGFVLAQLCDVVDLDGPANLADDALADSIYSDGRIFVPEATWGAQAIRS